MTQAPFQIFSSSQEASSFLKSGSVVAIGNYDGVHFGHQKILKELVDSAKSRGLRSVVLTFKPHPAKALSPDVAPLMIMTQIQKERELQKLGVDAVVFQEFNTDFAKVSPEGFVEEVLLRDLSAKEVFVGYDFTFGAKRSGTVETLQGLGEKHDFDVRTFSAQILEDTLVSSTMIRRLLRDGQVRLASKYLTRHLELVGQVIPGHKRGTALGIHTANLKVENELLPKDGVYATFAVYNEKIYQAVTNIGFNPTYNNTERSVETHIFDFDQEIYGRDLSLHFVERLRDEIQFVSPQALVQQIQKDIASAKEILKREDFS